MEKVTITADKMEELIRTTKNMGICSGSCSVFIKTINKNILNQHKQELMKNFNGIKFQIFHSLFIPDNIKAVFNLDIN
jgi:hypothetical protein